MMMLIAVIAKNLRRLFHGSEKFYLKISFSIGY